MAEAITDFGCQQKVECPADEGWRVAIEEDVCIGGQFVSVLMLGEKTVDGEAIRENPNPARRRLDERSLFIFRENK